MDSTTKPVPQKLTCEQLALSSEYRRLTKRMQKWVAVYIQGFLNNGTWDPVAATQAAFTTANLNVARATTWRVKKHPQMKVVLDLFLNSAKTPLEIKLDALTRELRDIERNLDASNAGGIAAQRMLSMRREVRREMDALAEQIAKGVQVTAPPELVVQSAPAAPHRFKVGETCIVSGKQYTVTQVSDKGKALAGEPL